MLNPEDNRAIEGLFDRLAEAERRTPERDREAEDLINRAVTRQPAAPYYLAQTVIVQQQALELAERQIAELEEQLARADRGGRSLLGGLFEGDRGRQNRPASRSPWDRQDAAETRVNSGGFGGGGFLAGAAQTAMGVAGGVLLGNAIGSLFGAGSAHAAEPASNADSGNDQQDSADSGNDDSGDLGGDGGFDTGGDF